MAKAGGVEAGSDEFQETKKRGRPSSTVVPIGTKVCQNHGVKPCPEFDDNSARFYVKCDQSEGRDSYTVLSNSAYAWVHLHQGLRLEEASGLYDNRFRWYSAVIGQFVSNDPLGFAAGDVNVRRYVENRSTQNVDPSGLDVIVLFDLGHGAAGHGHVAVLVGSDSTHWMYYSLLPAGARSAANAGLGGNVPLKIAEGWLGFRTLDDARKCKILRRYERFVRYTTTTEKNESAEKVGNDYFKEGSTYCLSNNCMDLAKNVLSGAGVKIDTARVGDRHSTGTVLFSGLFAIDDIFTTFARSISVDPQTPALTEFEVHKLANVSSPKNTYAKLIANPVDGMTHGAWKSILPPTLLEQQIELERKHPGLGLPAADGMTGSGRLIRPARP